MSETMSSQAMNTHPLYRLTKVDKTKATCLTIQRLLVEVEKGNLDFVNEFEKKYGRWRILQAKNDDGLTPIHLAVHTQNKIMTRHLLEWGFSPHAESTRYVRMPIEHACSVGEVRLLELLFEYGADPNYRLEYDYNLEDVPDVSVARRNIKIARQDYEQLDLVDDAIRGGSLDCLKCVLEHDAKFLIPQTFNDRLVVASEFGHLDIVVYLVETMHLPVDQADAHGMSPLVRACKSKHRDVAQYLMENGADVDIASCSMHRMPMMYCVLSRSKTILQLLLNTRADPNKADRDGNTALHLVCHGLWLTGLQILLQFQPDVTATNKRGKSALAVAEGLGPTVGVCSTEFLELLNSHMNNDEPPPQSEPTSERIVDLTSETEEETEEKS